MRFFSKASTTPAFSRKPILTSIYELLTSALRLIFDGSRLLLIKSFCVALKERITIIIFDQPTLFEAQIIRSL